MRRSLKITAAITSLALLGALSGCSGSSSAADKVLTVWTFKQSEVKALEAIGADWGKKNGMSVKVSVYTPDDAYATKIKSAAKSHTLPDVLSVHGQGEDWKFAQAGIIEDLTKDFTPSWQKQFLPGIVSGIHLSEQQIKNSGDDPTTTLKKLTAGHYYTVPFLGGASGVVFARKSMLQKAGVDPSTPPANWQDWIDEMKKTKSVDPTNGGLVTGLQVPETATTWLYRPMSYAYLGKDAFYGRESKKQDPSWTSAGSVKTLEFYDQLSDLWAPGVLALGIDQADQAFASGKAAWDVGGTFTLSSLTTFGLDAKDISMFAVPTAAGGKIDKLQYQSSPLIGASITSTSTHKAEALSFIKYLTSQAGAKTFAKTALDLPATALPASDLTDPQLRQMVALIATKEGGDAFNPNDSSADPAGTIAHDSAVVFAEFPAKAASVNKVAAQLSSLYKTAWANLK